MAEILETSNSRFQRSDLIDLLLFFVTFFCAYIFEWSATDLVWSLWVSSLTIGYFTLIFGPVISGMLVVPWSKFKGEVSIREAIQQIRSTPPSKIFSLIVILSVVAVFYVGFFTVHFGMFHYIHGAFLFSFFPLSWTNYPNPWGIPKYAITVAMNYWPFVLSSAISQLCRMWERRKEKMTASNFIAGPYSSVVRMHLMIFVFAILHFSHADNIVFYAVILLAYFFPWRLLARPKPPSDAVLS